MGDKFLFCSLCRIVLPEALHLKNNKYQNVEELAKLRRAIKNQYLTWFTYF